MLIRLGTIVSSLKSYLSNGPDPVLRFAHRSVADQSQLQLFTYKNTPMADSEALFQAL